MTFTSKKAKLVNARSFSHVLSMRVIAQSIILGIWLVTASNAGELSVRADPPDYYKRLNENPSWNIVLDGEIDSVLSARVAQALEKAGALPSRRLHQLPGVEAGWPPWNLAECSEKAELQPTSGDWRSTRLSHFSAIPCLYRHPLNASARVRSAFLGGAYRFSTTGSEFGVHRFYSENAPTDYDLDVGQILSEAVATEHSRDGC